MGSQLERSPQTAFPSYKRARVDAVAPEDRLSDLPDHLLHEIIGRLGSWQAAQTSALSRRWRHLWRSAPCLHIDQRQFPGSDKPGSRQRARFEDFADGMLASFAGVSLPLTAFRLYLVDGRSTASSERWIRRGLKRCPTSVGIRSSYADHSGVVQWPPRHLDMGAVACRLTCLRLAGVTLRDGFGEQLGAQCPVLQVLRIDSCHHQSYCAIVSPTLKSLEVTFPTRYSDHVTLAIAAPRLTFLLLRVPFGGEGGNPVITAPGHEALPSLVTALISISDRDCRPNKRANKTKLEFLRSMRGFLARISNVTNLRLEGFTTTVRILWLV
ncbi:MEIOTIC F-BOX protein MOF-like [Lolium perenne]|uniref:MEIOTIC F-BOX protein MOF-like n=1 Tax=Lolium perenne TaxID=4522 RepID=UPI0021F60C3F|nr:MEIOTIC F-BOX protein MOF-like [Lolium perenne]